MAVIRTIVHPTDFSAWSEEAFEVACSLARDYDAQLFILHVASLPDMAFGETPEADHPGPSAQLHHIEATDAGVRVRHRLVEGEPAGQIVQFADEVQADLIIMGTHGRTGVRRLLLGSVAEHVLRRALCPVLTITIPDLHEAVPRRRLQREHIGPGSERN
jgi:nucleotide-binding universal stress UspA family protein